jgi:hypothetical protein
MKIYKINGVSYFISDKGNPLDLFLKLGGGVPTPIDFWSSKMVKHWFSYHCN